MKTIRAVAFVFFLASLGEVIAHAQPANSCVYQYSFINSHGVDSFGFCLTAYGTLASLQSPLGTEHLDSANPLEGFQVFDESESVPVDLVIFPGFEVTQAPSAVNQPKGPGKLPIIFTYEGGKIGNRDTITVTANPSEKTVVFTMTVGKYIFQFNAGFGSVTRNAGLFVDGLDTNTFANSGLAAFSYNPAGHEVTISGSWCTTRANQCAESSGYVSQKYGQKAVQEQGRFDTGGKSTAVFSYKVF